MDLLRVVDELPKLVDKYVAGWLATCGSGTLAVSIRHI